MSIALQETKESIGAALLPIIEKLLPKLQSLGNFVRDNTGLIVTLGLVIGTLAAAILAINAGLTIYNTIQALTAALNTALTASFSALWVATGAVVILAVVAALVALQAKFDIFGKAIDAIKIAAEAVWNAIKTVFDWVKDHWQLLLAILTGPIGLAVAFFVKFKNDIWNIIKTIVQGIKTTWDTLVSIITTPFRLAFNGIASIWNNTVGKLSFKVPSWVPVIGGKGFDVPDIPMLAEGGIVTGPTVAMIGEAGPEAVIPLSKAGIMGNTINITVTSADPNAVVAALQQYVRLNNRLPANAIG
jgi:phage-related minor tail protein